MLKRLLTKPVLSFIFSMLIIDVTYSLQGHAFLATFSIPIVEHDLEQYGNTEVCDAVGTVLTIQRIRELDPDLYFNHGTYQCIADMPNPKTLDDIHSVSINNQK